MSNTITTTTKDNNDKNRNNNNNILKHTNHINIIYQLIRVKRSLGESEEPSVQGELPVYFNLKQDALQFRLQYSKHMHSSGYVFRIRVEIYGSHTWRT